MRLFNCQGNSAFSLSLICIEKSLSLVRMQRRAAAKDTCTFVVIVGQAIFWVSSISRIEN